MSQSQDAQADKQARQLREYLALPADQRAAPEADLSGPALHPTGTRIRLVAMGPDPSPLEPGETGTVTGGNGGQLWVRWDSGRTLSLLPGADRWEVIKAG